jgi:hypothetical protein
MMADDLSAPLGLDRSAVSPRSKVFVFLALAGLFGAALAAFVVWRAASHRRPPQGLSVVASLKLDSASPSLLPDLRLREHDPAPAANDGTTGPPDVIPVTKAQEFAREAAPDETEAGPGEEAITIIDGQSGARRRIRIPAVIPSGPGRRGPGKAK